MDLQLLLSEEVAKKAFAQLYMVWQLCPFQDQEAFQVVTPALVIS